MSTWLPMMRPSLLAALREQPRCASAPAASFAQPAAGRFAKRLDCGPDGTEGMQTIASIALDARTAPAQTRLHPRTEPARDSDPADRADSGARALGFGWRSIGIISGFSMPALRLKPEKPTRAPGLMVRTNAGSPWLSTFMRFASDELGAGRTLGNSRRNRPA